MENSATSKLMHTVFVYGTLRRQGWNHHFLDSSKFIGTAKTKQEYALFGSGVPFLSRRRTVVQVTGEVYAVDDPTLERLDELEGHPDAYRREQAKVVLETGAELTAWIYFYDAPPSHARLIESGDFLKKTQSRRKLSV